MCLTWKHYKSKKGNGISLSSKIITHFSGCNDLDTECFNIKYILLPDGDDLFCCYILRFALTVTFALHETDLQKGTKL